MEIKRLLKDWGALLTALTILVVCSMWLARLDARVELLEKQSEMVTTSIAKGDRPTTRADLCMKVIERMSDSMKKNDDVEAAQLEAQLDKLGCGFVNASDRTLRNEQKPQP